MMSSYILIHGGAHTSLCWGPLLAHLSNPSMVIDLPGRGANPGKLSDITLDDFVSRAARDIDRLEAPIVVAHSMGGLTALRLVKMFGRRIRHTVFVACPIPVKGQSIDGLMKSFEPNRQTPNLAAGLPRNTAIQIFCNDMNEAQTQLSLLSLCPDTIHPYIAELDFHPDEVISGQRATYIKTELDLALPPVLQTQSIRNLGDPEVSILNAGHNPMISQPSQLATILNMIARRSE